MNKYRLLAWIWLPAVLVLTPYNSLTMYWEGAISGEWRPLSWFVIQETTSTTTLCLILAPIAFFSERLLVTHHNWWWKLPLLTCLFVGFSLMHTTLMYTARDWIYPVFGIIWESRPYPGRYLYESRIQIIGFALMLVTIHLAEAGYQRLSQQRELNQLELRAAQLETQATKAQLENLRAQLHPHFLFNTLNVISSLMYEDLDRADKLIADLSDLLRLAFEGGQTHKVSFEKEVHFLTRYLDIMKARYQDRLEISFEVPESTLRLAVPYLILQPLVENAIKHMRLEQDQPAWIQVRAQIQEQQLCLEVLDNGPGLRWSQDELFGRGVGLTNTRERLTSLYGDKARLSLSNREGGGVRARVDLPAEAVLAESRSLVEANNPLHRNIAGKEVVDDKSL